MSIHSTERKRELPGDQVGVVTPNWVRVCLRRRWPSCGEPWMCVVMSYWKMRNSWMPSTKPKGSGICRVGFARGSMPPREKPRRDPDSGCIFLTSNHFSSARRASLASAFPCSTAWRYHWIAWALLCGTPRPCSYRRPNLNLASESSCAAAAEYHLKASA